MTSYANMKDDLDKIKAAHTEALSMIAAKSGTDSMDYLQSKIAFEELEGRFQTKLDSMPNIPPPHADYGMTRMM